MLTFQRFIPLLHFEDRLVEIVITQWPLFHSIPITRPRCSAQSPTATATQRSSVVLHVVLRTSRHLPACRDHPRMSKQLLGRDPKVAIFLETMIEEVFHYGRRAFRDRGTVVLDDSEERRHWIQEVVWRLALE